MRKKPTIDTVAEIAISLGAIGLLVFMMWSLWNLSSSPLHPTQRLWWMFAILILPGLGSFAWWWWIKRYYPRRKATDPDWDPATRNYVQQSMGRPRPGRGKYRSPGD